MSNNKDSIICWRGSDSDIEPVKCICETKFGYPNKCTNENGDSETMYINTHFLTETEAWESICRSVKASILLSGRVVKQAKDELLSAERMAGNAAERFYTVMNDDRNPFK